MECIDEDRKSQVGNRQMAARLPAPQLLLVLPGPPRRRGQDGLAGWSHRERSLSTLPQDGAARGCGEVLGDFPEGVGLSPRVS